MKCPRCKFETPAGAKFCNECGCKLEISCSECSSINPPGSKFCVECGYQLTQSPPSQRKDLSFDQKIQKIQKYLPEGLTEKILAQRDRIEGERKQVTVMFCDMQGFTSLSELVGIEEAYSIMDEVSEGTWESMPAKRRSAFLESMPPVFQEWDAAMNETTTIDTWASLKAKTLVVYAADTKRPIREIVELFVDACPHWSFKEIAEGGHMAPLFQPELVNPIVTEFLNSIEASS